jgi:hypothetical protein
MKNLKPYKLQIAFISIDGAIEYQPFDSFNNLDRAIETAQGIAYQSRVIDTDGNELFTTVR